MPIEKRDFSKWAITVMTPSGVPLLKFYTPVGVDSSETSGRHGPRMPVENFYKAMSSTPIVMGMAAAKVTPASMDRARSLPFSCLLAPPKIHFAPHCGRSDLFPSDGVLMRRSCLNSRRTGRGEFEERGGLWSWRMRG